MPIRIDTDKKIFLFAINLYYKVVNAALKFIKFVYSDSVANFKNDVVLALTFSFHPK